MEKGGSSKRSEQIIPGPAGKVQVAIRRKRSNDPSSFNEVGEQMLTQEFIQKVYEEPPSADVDFVSEPWIFAMEYLRLEGKVATPFNEIRRVRMWQKIPCVVGMVTEVNPNGLGDVMISLKDPTGIMAASVHKKVYHKSDIKVGSVLVLLNVPVATLLKQSECFLNITPKNVLKVIPKDMTTDDIFNPEVVADSDVE